MDTIQSIPSFLKKSSFNPKFRSVASKPPSFFFLLSKKSLLQILDETFWEDFCDKNSSQILDETFLGGFLRPKIHRLRHLHRPKRHQVNVLLPFCLVESTRLAAPSMALWTARSQLDQPNGWLNNGKGGKVGKHLRWPCPAEICRISLQQKGY